MSYLNGQTDYMVVCPFHEFYKQNQMLREQFSVSDRIDFGLMDTKMIFDYQNKLFCMSKNPDKTVFEGKQLKSFTIKEDSMLLFEGSVSGIKSYASTVPECTMALAPQITQFMINRQLTKTLDRLDDGKENRSTFTQYFDIPEPFRAFQVELHFEHPYWMVIKCDMNGPRFSDERPDVNDYLRSYQQNIEEMGKLVYALKTVAFPDAPEKSIGFDVEEIQAVHTTASHAENIEDIRKYKALMDDGIISQGEFEAKKKMLLGR